jgi:hypothetical protein
MTTIDPEVLVGAVEVIACYFSQWWTFVVITRFVIVVVVVIIASGFLMLILLLLRGMGRRGDDASDASCRAVHRPAVG